MRIDRLNQMELYISQRGSASLDELVAEFGISKNTVRRDIEEILKRGCYEKTYGGISVAYKMAVASSPSECRMLQASSAKEQIALAAATLVSDNSCIFLDSGTTAFKLFKPISRKNNVTIITNSLPVMIEASKVGNVRLFSLGGLYLPETGSYQGEITMEIFDMLNADMAFIGTSAISLECGLSNSTHYDAMLKRKIVKHIPKIVVVTDSSKFDRRALFSFCELDSLYAIVTEKEPPKEYCEYFAKHGIRLVIPESSAKS